MLGKTELKQMDLERTVSALSFVPCMPICFLWSFPYASNFMGDFMSQQILENILSPLEKSLSITFETVCVLGPSLNSICLSHVVFQNFPAWAVFGCSIARKSLFAQEIPLNPERRQEWQSNSLLPCFSTLPRVR